MHNSKLWRKSIILQSRSQLPKYVEIVFLNFSLFNQFDISPEREDSWWNEWSGRFRKKKKNNGNSIYFCQKKNLKYLTCDCNQVHLPPETANVNGFISGNPNNMLDWLPPRDPQVQILNFLDSNGLLPMRCLHSYTREKKKEEVLLALICISSFTWRQKP